MSSSRVDTLQAGREMLGLSLGELWIAYMRLGGNLPPYVINAYFQGGPEISDHDYDILAHALNEHFLDQESNHPIAYVEDLPPRD